MSWTDITVLLLGAASSFYLYSKAQASKYPALQLDSILLYPVKSLPPIFVNSAELDVRGLKGDRTFMLVSRDDSKGEDKWKEHYISTHPKNALLIPMISSDGSLLTITAPSGKNFKTELVPPPPATNVRKIPIKMHSSAVEGIDMGEEAAVFFTEACGLGIETRLVYIDQENRREVLGSMGGGIDKGLAFQDCASYMVASTASLDAVRAGLNGQPISIIPFRPTFVVSPKKGAELPAWAEDWWAEIRISEVASIRLTSNCVRCVSLNIDYETGDYKKGPDLPFKVLTKSRLVDVGSPYSPVFGRYGFSTDVGATVRVGDSVQVTKLNRKRTVFDWPGL